MERHNDAVFHDPFNAIYDLLWPDRTEPSIHDPSTGRSCSHASLAKTVAEFRLPIPQSVTSKPVVAILLPNGPLLALTVFAVANRYKAAPINAASGADQVKTDVLEAGSNIILVNANDRKRLGLEEAWVAEEGIEVLSIELGHDMTLELTQSDVISSSPEGAHHQNVGTDISIILFTSGTSGKKKLVPLTTKTILAGVKFVIDSWGLTPTDVCANLMPLNHVGGLVRNLFAPVISAGSTVCCKGFDRNLFWDVVEELGPTWYYASPTMHSTILDEAPNRASALSKSDIRLVCNAAGGLLPSLAVQLRDTFNCIVLPSYGMTECMPISSPPLDYRLDRTGTSGVSVGPDLAIFDQYDRPCESGVVGNIVVRGEPVFPGYLRKDGSFDTSCFKPEGWFDTGDMGYMDDDGFLFVTGRNKEVINRGGELISPFEVEEAIVTAAQKPDSPIFGRVSQALAFVARHDVLQEVVGVILVTPENSPRTDLRQLQKAVRSSLQQAKWPTLVVFMDNLPKKNNKILRIKIGTRLGLPEITDETPMTLRHYEATCPPPDTDGTVPIPSRLCEIGYQDCNDTFESIFPNFAVHTRKDVKTGFPEVILAPADLESEPATPEIWKTHEADLRTRLHDYSMPEKVQFLASPLPKTVNGVIDNMAIDMLLAKSSENLQQTSNLTVLEHRVALCFVEVLSCSVGDLSPESDFFEIGGDSLKAGRLMSMIRKEFQLRLDLETLYNHAKLGQLSRLIEEKQPDTTAFHNNAHTAPELPGCTKTYSSRNPFLLIFQLLPLIIMYPAKRALTWTIFIYCLTGTQGWATTATVPGRLVNLVFSLAVARLITRFVSPLLAIWCKWVIIGRYKEGMYPMWGWYHTRWWLVQKILQIGGMGHFSFSNWTRVLYYRMLGADIGSNVAIAKGVTFGEYDLLKIGDSVNLDKCICRPFAAERNTSMYLGRIVLGKNCSIGHCSIVAAGTTVPEDACIGPNSSSWEVKDATESNRDVSASKIPGCHWILNAFIIMPVMVVVRFIQALPWMIGLIGLVLTEPKPSVDQLASVLFWFASPGRIGFHYLALILNTALGPVFMFAFVVFLKKITDLAIGKLQPSEASSRCQAQRFRTSFLKAIMPGTIFHKVTELFGVHYGFTSFAMRLMGAKVGERVYWPGTGPSIQDYDLVEVGNDVVFGSRSHLVTSDGIGSDKVIIGDSAMVADRVVLLPGARVGNETIMGSGALGRRDGTYPDKTTWVGSRGGEARQLTRREKSVTSDSSESLSSQSSGSPTTLCCDLPDSSRLDLEKQPISWASTPTVSLKATPFTSMSPTPEGSIHGFQPSPLGKEVKSSVEILPLPSGKESDSEMIDYTHEIKRELSVKVQEVRAAKKNKPDQASSPFGRAFYEGKAPYRVLGQFSIFLYSAFTTIFAAFYWNVGTTSAVQVVAQLVSLNSKGLMLKWWRPLTLYCFFLSFIAILMSLQALLALGIVIWSKWLLMGRRQQGSYDWDKSSYNQRWQVFLAIEKLRRQCYGGHGILGMLTGTHWAVLYFRALGATIGKDCALFAGGLPSLMFTEPDLLTLGDRVAVDDASLVGHLNTGGHFTLNPLVVGDRSVLRTGARLLSGARMEEDSCLLEHTLMMSGDSADSGSTFQGFPSEPFTDSRVPTIKTDHSAP
ncbi:MAG: putative NRPS-like protein biosynthetic cluster [Bogoriella megaspora]|nr:MAG: putative NRPS-like protein biosynthetic cluster [Bogoriella megaspora]